MKLKKVIEREREREREKLSKFKSQLTNHEANLRKFDQQGFVTGQLEADFYNRLKPHSQTQIEKLKLDREALRSEGTAFEK
ncbi:hypothetical protein [Neochlamydia sp. AcF95]|uniref:hypothetical protein n=1 Tax=Neochlamydia sp. AcF95 TaxID=2795734 RepID=UPI001BCA6290|nr:hypothetical protein [Neochlamydia sp. AcF95]